MVFRSPALCLATMFLVGGLGACTDSGDGDDMGTATSGLPEPDPDADPLVVPTDPGSLLEWLVAEPYLDWEAESAIHDSAGPHFGNVRTWVHPDLFASLEAGNEQHPAGSASVKELYGDAQGRRGWAVMVKTADDSAGGDGWYWYEYYDGGIVIEGQGSAACTGCHSSGADYVRTPFPLQ